MSASLLVELRTEELPPKSLARLGESFLSSMRKALVDAGFVAPDAGGEYFATPRRLAVRFAGVLPVQPDRQIERKGPAVASGLDAAGQPTKALEGFMRAAGLTFSQLERSSDGKAEYFVARSRRAGSALEESLAGFVETALKALPVPKVMRWGDGEVQFVRPVHGIVMLHGTRLMPGKVLGLNAATTTCGHRFLSRGEIEISAADEYEDQLERTGKVLASFGRRRARIEEQLLGEAQRQGLRLNDGYGNLLDEVTALTEWPVVYAGEFEEEFLSVPQECLILTMQQNQKYFPLLDAAGRLSNRFLIVSNMEVADPRHIIGGNQRVVRPRLADARFFFEQDRKLRLEDRIERLTNVVYHNKLGSQRGRVERLRKLAVRLAERIGADTQAADRAALLAKADLVSDMVGEFPELQGTMGRYYARHDGEPPAVAEAIAEHYLPRFAGDVLPAGQVSIAVALADRLLTLAGFFGIGQVPSGDKDPFGLRRAALGTIRILIECALPLSLHDLISDAFEVYERTIGQAHTDLTMFVLERLRGLLRDQGYSAQEVDAVVSMHPNNLDLLPAVLAAVREFQRLPEAQSLSAANKRVVNILRKSAEAGEALAAVDPQGFVEAAERGLHTVLGEVSRDAAAKLAGQDYTGYLRAFATLKAPIDRFFDEVMVMSEDAVLRTNRIALLGELRSAMNKIADLSKLAI